ncbi:MAG TPA: lipocalin family protein [Flavobacterium sp.]|nr:lipocalin family protein [Flavobacterium sp.]
MKTKSILLLSALTLGLGLLTGCNKDDDKYELPPATLLGKWYYSKVGTNVGGAEVLANYDGNEAGCTKDYIELTDNNVFADIDFDSTDAPCEAISRVGTWASTGNTVVVDYGDDVITGTILNLSYTELKVQDNDSGQIVVYTRE